MANEKPIRGVNDYMPLFNGLACALFSLLLPLRKDENEHFADAMSDCNKLLFQNRQLATEVARTEDDGMSWLETIEETITTPLVDSNKYKKRAKSLTPREKHEFATSVMQLAFRTVRCMPETMYESAYKIDDSRLAILSETRSKLDEIISDVEATNISDALETATALRDQLNRWEDSVSKQLAKWEDAVDNLKSDSDSAGT